MKAFIAPIFRYLKSAVREKKKSLTRSSKWNAVRDDHLAQNPKCAACGSDRHLQVHHIKPFHLHPELELEFSNLITLCMGSYECHLSIGHGDNFRCYNPNVVEDAKKFYESPSERKVIAENAKTTRLK